MGRAYKDEGALPGKDSSWGVLRPEFQGLVTVGELLLPSGFTPVTLRSMKWFLPDRQEHLTGAQVGWACEVHFVFTPSHTCRNRRSERLRLILRPHSLGSARARMWPCSS